MSRDPIADLVHRYSDAAVRHEGKQLGNTWAENAKWNLGRGRGAPNLSGDFLNLINPE